MTEEQGYAKRKIEFQDQLLNLNPQQQIPINISGAELGADISE